MKHKIEVTQADIDLALKHQTKHTNNLCWACYCPITRAIKRTLGCRDVTVCDERIEIKEIVFPSIKKVADFVERVDSNLKVKPFSFVINDTANEIKLK